MDYFKFGNKLDGEMDPRLNNDIMINLWNGFCCGCCKLIAYSGKDNSFRCGDAALPERPEEEDFSISISLTGIAISAKDYSGLVKAFSTVMMRIEPVSLEKNEELFRIKCGNIQSKYNINIRMIHFCVFPETEMNFLKKCIRLAGIMQYMLLIS